MYLFARVAFHLPRFHCSDALCLQRNTGPLSAYTPTFCTYAPLRSFWYSYFCTQVPSNAKVKLPYSLRGNLQFKPRSTPAVCISPRLSRLATTESRLLPSAEYTKLFLYLS